MHATVMAKTREQRSGHYVGVEHCKYRKSDATWVSLYLIMNDKNPCLKLNWLKPYP
jgi:hypothetical protein